MSKPNNAVSAVREFMRAVGGDIRILQRELQNDPDGKIALEEVGYFLTETAKELLAGAAPQPETPGRSLADFVQRPEPAAPEAAAPEDDEGPAAALLQQMRK